MFRHAVASLFTKHAFLPFIPFMSIYTRFDNCSSWREKNMFSDKYDNNIYKNISKCVSNLLLFQILTPSDQGGMSCVFADHILTRIFFGTLIPNFFLQNFKKNFRLKIQKFCVKRTFVVLKNINFSVLKINFFVLKNNFFRVKKISFFVLKK